VIREYIWLDGRPLAVVEDGQVFWLSWDHILRPVLATDATGAVVWAARYLPFGGIDQVIVDTGALTQNLRFPGQWFQAETGLHQNWMRDYDPTTGRYLQADPLGLVDGPSVYGYARQSPVRYTDPRGLDAFVYYWSRGTRAGHLGIGTDFNEIFGQNPNLGGLLSCCVERPGEIKRENYAYDGIHPPEGLLQITLNDALTRQLKVCINRRRIQSLPYRVLSQSCVDFVGQCIAEAGVEIPDRWRPRDFYNDLRESKSEFYKVYEIYNSTRTLNGKQ
jgi:RHS repeat-associated protein